MPVVTVVSAPHPRAGELLIGVADAIAGALGLGDGDVIATHVGAAMSATSGALTATAAIDWPIVTIHGSAREHEKMDAARAAVVSVVEDWHARHDVRCEGVWTQWLVQQA